LALGTNGSISEKGKRRAYLITWIFAKIYLEKTYSMNLKKIIITGFKSIKGTEEVLLDNKINILIGANDHGKTNILAAILRLNDDSPIVEDDRNWDLPDTGAVRIQWHFSIDPKELEEFRFSPDKDAASTGEQTETPDTSEEAPDEPMQTNGDNEIIYYREGINEPVYVHSTPIPISELRENDLLALKPKVELFEAPKTNLVDIVNHAQLTTPEFEFMQGIFMLAGIWEQRDTVFTADDKTSKILDEASKRLTTVLNDQWNQGKNLNWKLKHAGTNGDHIEIKIEDPSVRNRYTRPSLKSSGFQTYFLISMIVLARTQKDDAEKYIYLFDEPGTYLHPHAQLDLQRSFEIISDDAQIIYTTHALFLINKNYPRRNKVVSKTVDGTKIDQKPFQKNWKSVRESLGILLSNNFLIAEKTLLTEGPSDVIYILDAIKRLKEEEKLDVDLNDLSIVDAGSPDNYLAMAKLMLSEGRDVVALVDGDKAGEENKKKLLKTCQKEYEGGKLKIVTLPTGKSIEDIFTDITILQEAIAGVSKSIVDNGVRAYKDGIKLEDEIKKIKPSSTATLGAIIDEKTSSLFVKEEKLSKLSIALAYEDLVAQKKTSVSNEASKILDQLKKELSLRGEKAPDVGVFETVG
jgi:predicted ATP-dependent endonuclease of OLD family